MQYYQGGQIPRGLVTCTVCLPLSWRRGAVTGGMLHHMPRKKETLRRHGEDLGKNRKSYIFPGRRAFWVGPGRAFLLVVFGKVAPEGRADQSHGEVLLACFTIVSHIEPCM